MRKPVAAKASKGLTNIAIKTTGWLFSSMAIPKRARTPLLILRSIPAPVAPMVLSTHVTGIPSNAAVTDSSRSRLNIAGGAIPPRICPFMFRRLCTFFSIPALCLASFHLLARAEQFARLDDSFTSDIRPLIAEYCSKCHGPARPKAGVNLSVFTNTVSVYRDARLWERVLAKLDSGEMPPEGKPQPTSAQRSTLLQWTRLTLDDLDHGRFPAD